MSFAAYKEDGTQMFDAQFISYGLRRSGFMTLINTLPRYRFRSPGLDPNDPGSYAQTAPMDPVYGFSVAGVVAPIVFIEGIGRFAGTSFDNGVTTFMYSLANENTKFFYFDTMRDFVIGAGLKTFRDTPGNELTFNSAMVPLDIDHSISYPLPGPAYPAGSTFYAQPLGPTGLKSWIRPTGNPSHASCMAIKVNIDLGPYTYAAVSSFGRVWGQGRQDNMSTPIDPGAERGEALVASMSASDGVFGRQGGITIIAADAVRTSMNGWNTYGAGVYWDVPIDRIPTALVIRSDVLPFPYSVG